METMVTLDTHDHDKALQVLWSGDESLCSLFYPDDAPAALIENDVVRCPRLGRGIRVPETRAYTYFELMILIHGADDAPSA
jgi:hypothetical protein